MLKLVTEESVSAVRPLVAAVKLPPPSRRRRPDSPVGLLWPRPPPQVTTEKHWMSFPETVDEILDVSEDEGGFFGARAGASCRSGAPRVTPCPFALVGVAQLTLGRPHGCPSLIVFLSSQFLWVSLSRRLASPSAWSSSAGG